MKKKQIKCFHNKQQNYIYDGNIKQKCKKKSERAEDRVFILSCIQKICKTMILKRANTFHPHERCDVKLVFIIFQQLKFANPHQNRLFFLFCFLTFCFWPFRKSLKFFFSFITTAVEIHPFTLLND